MTQPDQSESGHPLHALRAEWDKSGRSGNYTTWLEWKAVRLSEAVDLLREAQRSTVWQETVPIGRRSRWASDVDALIRVASDEDGPDRMLTDRQHIEVVSIIRNLLLALGAREGLDEYAAYCAMIDRAARALSDQTQGGHGNHWCAEWQKPDTPGVCGLCWDHAEAVLNAALTKTAVGEKEL